MFGFAAMVSQVLLFRELLVLSTGNELSVGLIFCVWLLGVGVGSAVGGVTSRRKTPGPAALAAAAGLLAAAVPWGIVFARAARAAMGFVPGETLPFSALCRMMPLAAAPAAMLVGLLFVWLCAVARDGNASSAAPARVYMLETAGSFLGSIAFCFVIVFLFSPLSFGLMLGVMLCAGFALWVRGKDGRIAVTGAAVCLIILIISGRSLEQYSRRVQWKGYRVVETAESAHGHLAAVQDRGQISIFENGRLVDTVPDRVGGAFRVHVPLSLHPRPRAVLIAGGGPSMVREARKHGARVTLVELNPMLLALRRNYISEADFKLMYGPGVREQITDARLYITRTSDRFDAILMSMGEPDTLVTNRYYTLEFFRSVKKRLNPGGIFSMKISFQENSMSQWQAELLGTQLRTLTAVFPRPILVIGRDGALFITAKDRTLEYDPESAIRNYEKRNIHADNFGIDLLFQALDRRRMEETLKQPRLIGRNDMRGLLDYDMQPDKIGGVYKRLMRLPGARVNRDFHPISVYYQSRISSAYYPGALTRFFRSVNPERARRAWLIFIAIACVLLTVLSATGLLRGAAAAAPGAAAAGCAGMALEVAAVFVFQALNGVIYYYIGILLAAFMAGGFAGSRFAARWIRARLKSAGSFLKLSLILLSLLCAAASFGPTALQGVDGVGVFAVVLFVIFTGGALVGAVYAFAAASSRGSAGALYAADHIGAAFGALAASVILIPLAGIAVTLWLCAAAVFASVIPLFAAPPQR